MLDNIKNISDLINFDNKKKDFDNNILNIINLIKDKTGIILNKNNIIIKNNNVINIKSDSNIRFYVYLNLNSIKDGLKDINNNLIIEL